MSKILTTLPPQPTKRLDAPKFSYSQILFLFLFQLIFHKTVAKSQKYSFVVQFHRRGPYRNLQYKKYKRPPRAKRPPTTDRAERLTQFRESRPPPPTTSAALVLPPQPRSQKTAGKFFCYGWSALHNQPHMPIVGRTAAPPLPPEI